MAKYEFPSTPSPTNVTELFEKIQTLGVPKSKINVGYLKLIGFKSSYDTHLVGVLKSLWFVTADGSPSNMWKDYGVKMQARSVIASAIKNTYSKLFETYADAYVQGDAPLLDLFKGRTGAPDKDAGLMLKTFWNLCALGDFEAVPAEAVVPTPPVTPLSPDRITPEVKVAPNLQLNIEIHIAADTPDDKIEAIFKNMKTYLLSNEWLFNRPVSGAKIYS